jgi:hypothetical protein
MEKNIMAHDTRRIEYIPFGGKSLALARQWGYLYDYEVLALQVVARMLPVNAKIINFGAGTGTSSMSIIESRPDLAIWTWTIDISAGGPLGGLENERNAYRDAGIPHLLPQQILSDSSKAGREWTKGMVDFVFVDGDHSLEGVIKDIEAWKPRVNPGGIMAFHDYEKDVWKDVKIGVDDKMSDCTEIVTVDTLRILRLPV